MGSIVLCGQGEVGHCVEVTTVGKSRCGEHPYMQWFLCYALLSTQFTGQDTFTVKMRCRVLESRIDEVRLNVTVSSDLWAKNY